MEEKVLTVIGANSHIIVKKKAKKRLKKICNYVKNIVNYNPNEGCYTKSIKEYKDKLPNIYFVIKVSSHTDGGNINSTDIHIRTTTEDGLPYIAKNNLVSIEKDNKGCKNWTVYFYEKVNDMKYTRDELVKKALKYAKKKGVKIFKNNITIF